MGQCVAKINLQDRLDELENKLSYMIDGYYGSLVVDLMEEIQALMKEVADGTVRS